MVKKNDGWAHQWLKIEVIRPSNGDVVYTFNGSTTCDNAQIRWGRESLFSPPANRTLAADVLLSEIYGIDTLWHWRALTARAKFGSVTLFEGAIDSIAVHPFRRDMFKVHIEATETPRADSWMKEEKGYEYMYPVAAQSYAEAHGYEIASRPIDVYPDIYYATGDLEKYKIPEYRFTGEQLLRLAAAPYPGAFVQWYPGLKKAGSTMASFKTSQDPLPLKASQVQIADPEIRLEESPYYLYMQSENAWVKDIPRLGGRFIDAALTAENSALSIRQIAERRLDNPITFRPEDTSRSRENSFVEAASIIRGQITAPLQIIFHDSLLDGTQRNYELFFTWEQENNITVSGAEDRWTQFGWTNRVFRIIGGTLSFKHGHSTHTTTAVWATPHPEWGTPNASDLRFYRTFRDVWR